MNRMEFIRQLEYLLQDIPEEEREDAIAYYRDYLEEAGDGGEEQAIGEFGSPERVAAMIRSDLQGHLEAGGEFTEAGYQDERFRDPNYQLAKRHELPEVYEEQPEKFQNQAKETAEERKEFKHRKDRDFRAALKQILKAGLICMVILVVGFPVLAVGESVFGVIAGIACVIAAGIICVGLFTAAASVGTVVLMVIGVGLLLMRPAAGVLVLGVGVATLGLALLGIAFSVLIYGKWLPSGIRWGVNTVSNLLHRRRKSA